jgi:hypothetical protein
MLQKLDSRRKWRVHAYPSATSDVAVEFLAELFIDLLCAIPELFL